MNKIAIVKEGPAMGEGKKEGMEPDGDEGLGMVRVPVAQLPPGVQAGMRGKASFVVDSVDDEGAELKIESVESDESAAPIREDEPDYEASMEPAYAGKKA